jgi:cytochrome c553
LRTATNIAWTGDTLAQISAGNSDHGAFIALNCAACHGQGGLSTSTFIPTLAGMDAAVIYKQLDDYRSDKRLWGVMGAMAKSLSPQASADVAAFFATQRDGLPPLGSNRVPESGRSLREADPAMRLVFAGDPQRGIPPCSACHGPGGYKLGAPALQGQRAAYIERQLASFAQGMRENDISEQMRVIAKQLTPDEMREVAAFYGAPAVPPTTGANSNRRTTTDAQITRTCNGSRRHARASGTRSSRAAQGKEDAHAGGRSEDGCGRPGRSGSRTHSRGHRRV